MIETYPNYLDQTQIIGLRAVLEYHGNSPVATMFPLNIALSKSLEFGIGITKATEYSVSITKLREYTIKLSKEGGG